VPLLSIFGSTAPMDLGHFLTFLVYTQSVGVLGRGISPSQGRYLHTEQHEHRINAHLSMPRVGFEPTIPEFERAKAVHALDRAATVIGSLPLFEQKYKNKLPRLCPQASAKSVPTFAWSAQRIPTAVFSVF
jgi:hypothetical protein